MIEDDFWIAGVSWGRGGGHLSSRGVLLHLAEVRMFARAVQLAARGPGRQVLPAEAGAGGVHLPPLQSHQKPFLPSCRQRHLKQPQ